jgi:hypothetical protein
VTINLFKNEENKNFNDHISANITNRNNSVNNVNSINEKISKLDVSVSSKKM